MLVLTCAMCRAEQTYSGVVPLLAVEAAQRDGWHLDDDRLVTPHTAAAGVCGPCLRPAQAARRDTDTC